ACKELGGDAGAEDEMQSVLRAAERVGNRAVGDHVRHNLGPVWAGRGELLEEERLGCGIIHVFSRAGSTRYQVGWGRYATDARPAANPRSARPRGIVRAQTRPAHRRLSHAPRDRWGRPRSRSAHAGTSD